MNLEKYDHLLEIAQTTPNLELAVDEYFDQIVHCIDQEKTQEAAKMIELVFAKGAADVRLIFYYFYIYFTEDGIKSFAETFPRIISLFDEHQNILLPVSKLEKHTQSSLNWFFSHLLLRYKYYEKMYASGKIHPIWKKSVLELSSENLEQLISCAEKLRNFFFERWPKHPTKDMVTHLLKKIEELRLIVKPLKPPEKIEETVLEKSPSQQNVSPHDATTNEAEQKTQLACQIPDQNRENIKKTLAEVPKDNEQNEQLFDQIPQNEDTGKFDNKKMKQKEKPTALSTLDIAYDESLLRNSIHELICKLQTFESLISKKHYLKATIVAQDIDRFIESFNVQNYFPKLFARYFSLLATHVPALSDQEVHKESMRARALENLYQTDLEMFIEWSDGSH